MRTYYPCMKLIQLNIERDLHLDRVKAFLTREQADVVCLEEVLEPSAHALAAELGYHVHYVPQKRISGYEEGTDGLAEGVALFTREPHMLLGEHYYVRSRETIQMRVKERDGTDENEDEIAKVALVADVRTGAECVRVAMTHFTWSANGGVSVYQRRDLRELLTITAPYGELVLCGDFNIPRGTELYHVLAQQYRDNVPPEYTTSLDQDLHRKKGLQFMVDYIWSTPAYAVTDVRMVCGVSDHCALVADVLHV